MAVVQPNIKTRAATVSVLSNTALVIGKLCVGLVIGSVSIMSEAIHSGIDLVAALIAWWAVRASSAPADDEHPFGHGKFENLSGVIEALLILVAAIWIVVEAAKKLVHPTPLEGTMLGIGIMAVSAIVNIFVSNWLMRVGRATDSIALTADAWHLRTDVYTSAGVMFGLVAIAIARRLAPNGSFDWIDPVVALLVALFIVKAAFQLSLGAVRDLLDSRLPLEELGSIESYMGTRKDVLGYHDLRTRKAGGWRFVEIHLELPPEMSVRDSHAIAHSVSRDIQERLPSSGSVMVHVDPSDGDPPSSRRGGRGSSAPPTI
jgi:cation diffusion facilitator family transporter